MDESELDRLAAYINAIADVIYGSDDPYKTADAVLSVLGRSVSDVDLEQEGILKRRLWENANSTALNAETSFSQVSAVPSLDPDDLITLLEQFDYLVSRNSQDGSITLIPPQKQLKR